MLFNPTGVFDPSIVSDERLRAAFVDLKESSIVRVGAGDCLGFCLVRATGPIADALRLALKSGRSISELPIPVRTPEYGTSSAAAAARTRESFSATTVEAFAELASAMEGGGEHLGPFGLELMLSCLIPKLDFEERILWDAIDLEQFASEIHKMIAIGIASSVVGAVLKQTIEEAVTGAATPPTMPMPSQSNGAFLLPVELVPSEDLTHRLQTAAQSGGSMNGSPFKGEPAYEQLFDKLTRALHRKPTTHVLLVGERGVGQNTVVMELAQRALTGGIPFLREKRFISVDARHTSPDESRPRLSAILSHVGNQPQLVTCVDGFAALLRNERGSSNKASLLSGVSRMRGQLIGMLTPRDYEELIADDADMLETFTRVDVEEPDPPAALNLLRHFAVGLEQKFRVTIEEEALRQAVMLSANYILNQRLPAKAIRILHQVCENIEYERAQQALVKERVTADDVVTVVSQISGVPEETLRGIAEKCDYVQSLGAEIVGQAQAVRDVATELGLIKAGLTDPNKPASVMLFVGQTGTGKTEMAKVLARFYSTSKRLRTYTLGNFVEPHSVASIIGVPPGYVGHDQGGRLIGDLNTDPYCVFLLDEADKAHPDVLQPFLNLFDEGWIRDQRGVKGYANKSIFILTTNVGQRMIADMAKQGKTPEEMAARMKEALAQIKHGKSNRPVFAPEFLARIKRVIVFQPLDQQAMVGICKKLVTEAKRIWQEKRQKALEVPDALVEHIGQEAHRLNEKSEGREGGRIVRKLIAELIEAQIQRETSDRPNEYRGCNTVTVEAEFSTPSGEGAPPSPRISIQFRQSVPA